MGSKSFTIDHILHGPSAPAVDPLTTSVGDHHSTYPDVHPQPLVPYWTAGDPAAYYPPSGWPNAAAIWLQSQQHHHAMPVDLSTGAQRPVAATGSIGPHSSLFDNVSNWMPSAAMTGCWPSAASPELSYSHHGLSTPMTSASVASPFFLAHPHSHDHAAIRLAAMAARRQHHHHHHHLPILHQQATRKGGQIRFTHRQSHHLEETFNSTRYLTPGQRRTLANRLALTERQVKTWFQNRRAKWRRTRKGEKLSANGLPKVDDNQTTIDIFDEEEEEEENDDDDDDDDLELSSEEEKPSNPNNQ